MDQYLEIFIEEAKEHLQNCNENLLKLEENPDDLMIINEIFRSAHTLKGMSATMGYEDMANLTHALEGVLDALRNGKFSFSSELLDKIFEAMDELENMVESIISGGDGRADVSEIIEQLQMLADSSNPVMKMVNPERETSANSSAGKLTYDEFEWTVIKQSREQGYHVYEVTIVLQPDCLLKSARVYMVFDAMEKIGEIIKSEPSVEDLEAEQFDNEFTFTLITKEPDRHVKETILNISEIAEVRIHPLDRANEPVDEPADQEESKGQLQNNGSKTKSSPTSGSTTKASGQKKATNMQRTIRVNIDRLNSVMNLFEELVIDRGRLEQIATELNHPELTETVEKISRVTSNLQTNILNIRMVPIETVFNRFPKMIRQLARDLGKKIRLHIVGQDTELDRTVIDEIGDPLIHLLRNSADHGIEMPEERKALGKPEEGTILLKAYHSGNQVFIEIEDDGAGINRDKVIQKALQNGLITEEEKDHLTDQEVYDLIFSSGFSTADKVSDVSGRGVGLDVVKNTIESLGGSISVTSERNKGSKFLIQLPLTLSIISILLVQVQDEKYGIPLTSILETGMIHKTDIQYAHDQPVIDFRGKIVPLLSLKEIFHVPVTKEQDQDNLSIVIIRKGDKIAALIVDQFIGQQEVVLKSLGNYLTDVFAISGATILGDGQISLILDCNALIK